MELRDRSSTPSFEAPILISAADSNSLMLQTESQILAMRVSPSTVTSHRPFASSAVASRNLQPRERLAAGISVVPYRYSAFAA